MKVSDRCETVVFRLERAWAEELKTKGPVDASLFSAGYKAIRTRILMSVVFMVISTVFQFLAPASFMSFLDYGFEVIEDSQSFLIRSFCDNI